MKNRIIFIYFSIVILALASCNSKDESSILKWSEYEKQKDSIVLNTQKSKKTQNLFLNYYYGMNEEDFNQLTHSYVEKGIIIKDDSTLKFPIQITHNPKPNNQYFQLTPLIKNKRLVSISLIAPSKPNILYSDHHYEIIELYHNYFNILSKKYNDPVLTSMDNTFHNSFWMSDNIIIDLKDNYKNIFITYNYIEEEKQIILHQKKLQDNIERLEDSISNINIQKGKRLDSITDRAF